MTKKTSSKKEGGLGGFLLFCFLLSMPFWLGGNSKEVKTAQASESPAQEYSATFVEQTESRVVLDVPYINQWLDTTGNKSVPNGELMCGAASSIMVLAYYGKIPFASESELQQYLTKDYEGIAPRIPGCDHLSGVFQRTAWSGHCRGSLPFNIHNFMKKSGLKPNTHSWLKTMEGIGTSAGEHLTLQQIKNQINSGNPLILNFTSGRLDHIVVVVGYDGDQLIVHDPYTNASQYTAPVAYETGKFAPYSVSADGRTIFPNKLKKGAIIYTIAPQNL